MGMRDMIQQMIEPLRERIVMSITRAVVEKVTSDKGIQRLKAVLLAGENRDKIEHFEPYGFTSKPLAGAEAVIVFPQANREHAIAIVVADRRHRLKDLEDGEVALHTDEVDHQVVLKRGGKFEMKNSSHEMTEVVNDGLAALRDGFVITLFGPQQIQHPVDPPAAIKTRHDTFVP